MSYSLKIVQPKYSWIRCSDKKFRFRRLRVSSIESYSNRLHCLIFNSLRFYCFPGWTSEYKYPDLHHSQIKTLQLLYQGLEEDADQKTIDALFHDVCFCLLAHRKSQYDVSLRLSNFFSPAICFLVLHCVTESGATPNTSGISNAVAPIMYAIRACIFRVVRKRVEAEGISIHEYVFMPVSMIQV